MGRKQDESAQDNIAIVIHMALGVQMIHHVTGKGLRIILRFNKAVFHHDLSHVGKHLSHSGITIWNHFPTLACHPCRSIKDHKRESRQQPASHNSSSDKTLPVEKVTIYTQ